jgi:hypothetical protein
MDKRIDLKFKPAPDAIKRATRCGRQFLKSHGLARGTIQSQATILYGLIQTVMEYGTLQAAEDQISVTLEVDNGSIHVEVRNTVDQTADERLEALDHTIQCIRGYHDPFEAYRRLKHSPTELLSRHPSRLSLAEVTLKSGATLDFVVDEDNVLRLSAVTRTNREMFQTA